MPHLVLIGDSVFDNAAYVEAGEDVATHMRAAIPTWDVQLAAVDGAVIDDVARQLPRIDRAATHLVVSVGGNDALGHVPLLTRPARSGAEVLGWFAEAVEQFEKRYRRMLACVLERALPTIVCTIYNGNLDAATARVARPALAIFDDAILRIAMEHGVPVIELRSVCSEPGDYANPIEPSAQGGRKIAAAIAAALARGPHGDP